MKDLKLYEIDEHYIDYLHSISPLMFKNKEVNQKNKRKYIGIVLEIDGFEYFAPLSSFKDKHIAMRETLDFLKVKNYAVINLNNMFPVPSNKYQYVDFSKEADPKYVALLLSEYRYIKSIQTKIRKNAATLYKIKCRDGNSTPLTKRCNDFQSLEKACLKYNN